MAARKITPTITYKEFTVAIKEATIDNFLYNIPPGYKLEVKGLAKRGRGRPRKQIAAEGHTIHIESLSPDSKILTPKQRFEIRGYYNKLVRDDPLKHPSKIITEVAAKFELSYKQIQLLCL